MSLDGVFLAVTQLTGAVKLIKMPPVLNPLDNEKDKSPAEILPGGAAIKPGAAIRSSNEFGSTQSRDPSEAETTILLKNDIEKYDFEVLDLSKVLINTIPAKKKNEFVDPFTFEEDKLPSSDDAPTEAV
jgi:hypothetical protein